MSSAWDFAFSFPRQYDIAISLYPSLEQAFIRTDISRTSSFVLKNFRMYKFPIMSSILLCRALLIMTAVINFDISPSLSSRRVFSYGMPVSRRISIAPCPLPVTPGMYGDVDHSSARRKGLVAG